MPVKTYKPRTPARRHMSTVVYSDLTKNKKPHKRLTRGKVSKAGRNVQGRLTVRHRGGGHKRKYRLIDFKREKFGIPAKVAAVEYDPNRSAFIALIVYKDGDKGYIIAPDKLKVGAEVMSSQEKIEAKTGNRMKITHIPDGNFVYNIEMEPGRGAQIVRSAGTMAQIMSREGKYAQVKLPSGEIRNILQESMATVGQTSNVDHGNIVIGKAGRQRWLGKRPTVLGKSMNPTDHPHGGGEGHAPVGIKKGPRTKWGKKAMGISTRKKKKYSDKLIIKDRKGNVKKS